MRGTPFQAPEPLSTIRNHMLVCYGKGARRHSLLLVKHREFRADTPRLPDAIEMLVAYFGVYLG